MHVSDTDKRDLVAYKLMNVSWTFLYKWEEYIYEDTPPASWAFFRRDSWGVFFLRLKDHKVREFLTLKKESLTVMHMG